MLKYLSAKYITIYLSLYMVPIFFTYFYIFYLKINKIKFYDFEFYIDRFSCNY